MGGWCGARISICLRFIFYSYFLFHDLPFSSCFSMFDFGFLPSLSSSFLLASTSFQSQIHQQLLTPSFLSLGDDPFWEAVNLWYGATGDIEWYDPGQVTTRGGALVITMDSTSTTQAGMTNGGFLCFI